MPAGFVFACGMLFGGLLALLGLYLANWRILRSWSSDLRKDR